MVLVSLITGFFGSFANLKRTIGTGFGGDPRTGRVILEGFATAVERGPAIDAWFDSRTGELGAIARAW